MLYTHTQFFLLFFDDWTIKKCQTKKKLLKIDNYNYSNVRVQYTHVHNNLRKQKHNVRGYCIRHYFCERLLSILL